MTSNTKKVWLSNLFLAAGVVLIGYGVYLALQPAESIEVEITDHSTLTDRLAGEAPRIPVVISNRTYSEIRLVGSDAC